MTLVARAPWRDGRDLPTTTWPHEYVVSEHATGSRRSSQPFAPASSAARASSAVFLGETRLYLFLGDHKYWTMTACADIDLDSGDYVLNRARLYRDAPRLRPAAGRPRPAGRCRPRASDEDGATPGSACPAGADGTRRGARLHAVAGRSPRPPRRGDRAQARADRAGAPRRPALARYPRARRRGGRAGRDRGPARPGLPLPPRPAHHRRDGDAAAPAAARVAAAFTARARPVPCTASTSGTLDGIRFHDTSRSRSVSACSPGRPAGAPDHSSAAPGVSTIQYGASHRTGTRRSYRVVSPHRGLRALMPLARRAP